MSIFEVFLEIPPEIQTGLVNGTLERIGGVVRESTSKAVVAWLRDATLSDSINPADGAIQGILGALGGLAANGLLINTAITSASLLAVTKRLNALNDAIASLRIELKAEFNRDRNTRFLASLSHTEDALASQDKSQRLERLTHAIRDLTGVRLDTAEDFKLAYAQNQTDNAIYHLTRLAFATTAIIRCHLELNEAEQARKRLKEYMQEFFIYTKDISRRMLGQHPAIYLYKKVPLDVVSRFMTVQMWLYDTDDPLQILDKLRDDFWNSGALPDVRVGLSVGGIGREVSEQNLKMLAQRLTQVEALIENQQRLEGYQLELAEMRMSFNDWNALTEGIDTPALLVNTERLKRLSVDTKDES